MKQIVNGIEYDTDNSWMVCRVDEIDPYEPWRNRKATLWRPNKTVHGHFFKIVAESTGFSFWRKRYKWIEAVSRDEARDIMESQGLSKAEMEAAGIEVKEPRKPNLSLIHI